MLFREGNKKDFLFIFFLRKALVWCLMMLTGLMTQNNNLIKRRVKSTMFSVLIICSYKWALMSLFMFTKAQDRQTWPEKPSPFFFSWLPGWQVKGRHHLTFDRLPEKKPP